MKNRGGVDHEIMEGKSTEPITTECSKKRKVHTEDVKELFDILMEVNSRPFYDAEESALGDLYRSHYLILPADMDLPIPPASAIGLELEEYKLSEFHIAAVYVLAKEQALSFGWDNVKAVKWACIRLGSVQAGWYAGQTSTLRKPVPIEAIKAFHADASEFAEYFPGASKLCGFIPFVIEVYFRQFSSSFKGSPAEFASEVKKLAKWMHYSDVIDYMDEATLYSEAFRWIGVKRPKEAIIEAGAETKIPNMFLTRKVTVASQALVTTANAIIAQMKSFHWWDGVAKASSFEAGTLVALAEKIRANPWKYHLLSSAYGEAPLSCDEVKEAFADVKLKKSPLGKAKVLAKHGKANGSIIYNLSRHFFIRLVRKKIKVEDIATSFQTEVGYSSACFS